MATEPAVDTLDDEPTAPTVSEVATEVEGDSSSSSDVWDQLLSDIDNDDEPEAAPASDVVAPEPSVQPPAPMGTPAVTSPAPATSHATTALPSVAAPVKVDAVPIAAGAPAQAVVPPIGVPQQPVQATAPVAATPQQQTTQTPAQTLDEIRQQYETSLASEYEAFLGPDVDVISEPQKVLSTMLARAHINITNAIISSLVPQLPHMINAQTAQATQREQIINDFVNAMPEPLRRLEHREELMGLGRLYKSQYPEANMDQIKEGVRMMVAVKYGPQMAMPPAAPQQSNQPQQRQQAFRPAGPGNIGGPPPTRTQMQRTPWDEIVDEFVQEDRS